MNSINLELKITGLDLTSNRVITVLEHSFPNVAFFSSDGFTFAAFSCQADFAVAESRSFAKELINFFPEITKISWRRDFVGYSEIASRLDVSSETVRTWATGLRGSYDFPAPSGYIGQSKHRSPFWLWNEVANWAISNQKLDDLEVYPNEDEIQQIENAISWLPKLKNFSFTPEIRTLHHMTLVYEPTNIQVGA